MGKGGLGDLEKELIQRAAAGDDYAFTQIVERFSPFLLAVILPVVRDPVTAEDILQETFVQVYRHLPSYGGGSFKHWLARIAVNKAIDWKRQHQRRPETLVEDLGRIDSFSTSYPSPEEEVVYKESLTYLLNLSGELPEEYRRTLIGFYLEGKDYRTLAAEAGVTIKTVESRLYRARKMLQEKWKGR